MTNIDSEQQFEDKAKIDNVETSSQVSDDEINDNHNLKSDRENSEFDEVILEEDDVIGSVCPDQDVENLTRERDMARDRYTRALADYQNFQRRSIQNEARARIQAKAGLMRDILPAMDHLELALSQGVDTQGNDALASLVEGVRIVRDELLKGFAAHKVVRIEVKAGDEFDPVRHEAMMHVDNNEIIPGNIAQMLQPGYAIDEIVIRPAKVSLAITADDVDNGTDTRNTITSE